MQKTSILLRQVHPHFYKNGHVASVSFLPNTDDNGLLSVYDSELITPESSWQHFTGILKKRSAGCWGVSVEEAEQCELTARCLSDGYFPEHAVVDFTAHIEKVRKVKSKILAERAELRGCLYLAQAV
jgi:hypothetical protein